MNEERVNIANVVWQLRDYFDKHEYDLYSKIIDPIEKQSYGHLARRKFVRYYLEESRYATENFYKNN